MTEKKEKQSDKQTETAPSFKGKYTSAVGRRKTSVAQVRLYKNGAGKIVVNQNPGEKYFSTPDLFAVVEQPLKLTGLQKDFDISVVVFGGGKNGQATAASHGIARALIKIDEKLKDVLKTKNLLTRDARKKERKKPGLKKARRAPQWSKR
jgi:small subunit ribosomal protein S9